MALKFLNDGYFAGKVGIGTDSPETTLHLYDTEGSILRLSSDQHGDVNKIEFDALNNGSIYHSITSNTNSGNLQIRAGDGGSGHEVNIYTDGLFAATFDSNQRLGIGTVYPGAKLEVTSQSQTLSTAKFDSIELQTYAVNNSWVGENLYFDGSFKYRANGYATALYFDGSGFDIRTAPSGSAGTAATLTTRFTILESNGNVGIGTTSPIQKLQVAGSAYVNGGTLFLDTNQFLKWGNSNQGIKAVNDGNMSFLTGGSEKMTLTSAGKVGIGTTNPQDALDVDWDAEGVATDNSGIRVRAYRPHLNLIDRSVYSTSNGHNFQIKADAAKLQFNATSADNETFDLTRMVIDKDGNVGIGTTSPVQKLHIVNTNGANIILNSNTGAENNGIWMTEGGVATPYTNGAYVYYDSTNNAFKINTGTSSLSTRFEIARDTGAIKFNSYGATDQTGTPTYLLGTDASGNIVKTNTVPGSAAGPYVTIGTAQTITGAKTFSTKISTSTAMFIQNTVASGDNYIAYTSGVKSANRGYNDGIGIFDVIDGTPLSVLHNNGNLNIGHSTTDAGYKLSVNGTFNAVGNATFAGDVVTTGTSFIGKASTSSYVPDDGVFGGIITNGGGFKITTNATDTLTLSAVGGNMTVRGEGSFGGIIDMNSNKITELAPGSNNLDAVNYQQLTDAVAGVLVYQGTWNASTNTPTLASGVGTPGYYYIVSVAGSTNLDGITDWLPGDWAIFSDQATDVWQKIDHTNVLNGAGTGNKVTKWSGSGTSYTLTDSILEDNGSELVSAGKIILNNVAGDRKIQFNRTGGNSYSIEQDSASLYFYNTSTSEAPLLFQNDGDVIMNAGNVGIGTPSPNEKLVVATGASGWGVFHGASGWNGLALMGNSAGSGSALIFGNDYAATPTEEYRIWLDGATDKLIFTPGATYKGDPSAITPTMVMDSGGNVGIGTVSPGAKLEIGAAANVAPKLRLTLNDSGSSINPGQEYAGIQWKGNDGQGDGVRADIRVFGGGTSGESYMSFGTMPAGTTASANAIERMRINPNGNVGIGSGALDTAGGDKLHVDGTLRVGPYFSVGDRDFIKLIPHGTDTKIYSPNERFHIENPDGNIIITPSSSGGVGIGTTTPSSKLQVVGGIQMADDTDTASAAKVGTLKYRVSGNNSYVDMCMQTGAATYEWVNIVQNNW